MQMSVFEYLARLYHSKPSGKGKPTTAIDPLIMRVGLVGVGILFFLLVASVIFSLLNITFSLLAMALPIFFIIMLFEWARR